ncbi:PEP-CTERM sorting domain-containing protein [Roseateles cellulosilyticus]|uniref:PEP-CTERM sorting domain-containing protein n=1 Tax=Pelomonas cellulosilytica TaxID=2906762 RepID=A0ABS8XWW6_9BURK|nr:PEP-CTERM sorting domain-containing protein [Pelomonas sp. P8]MCE4557149.1 PEP-CTERM sorting domain-containing protein [Pelomonas sp. P8]
MRTALIATTLALAALSSAHADTLPTDGSWAGFTVDANLPPYGFGWVADDGTPLSFNITIDPGFVGRLTVVDTGFSGDRFHVYDGGQLIGSTGASVNGDTRGDITFDPDAALANPAFSRGSFTLGAGTHAITGALFQSAIDVDYGPLNATIGGLKLTVSPVPEPATAALLLIGLGLLLGALRRRNDNNS